MGISGLRSFPGGGLCGYVQGLGTDSPLGMGLGCLFTPSPGHGIKGVDTHPLPWTLDQGGGYSPPPLDMGSGGWVLFPPQMTPSGSHHTYGRHVDGTHATGMHSCFSSLHEPEKKDLFP